MSNEELIDKIMEQNSLNFIGNLILSNQEIEVLKKYKINYQNCHDMKDLIFIINDYLNDIEMLDLEEVLVNISERDYYQNTNK